MKERSIILNADEVRGALDGSVTQLRRPVAKKLWPLLDQIAAYNGKPTWQCLDFDVKCPWDVERFWVKESWADVNTEEGPAILYRADSGLRTWHEFSETFGANYGAGPSMDYDAYPGDYCMWWSDLLAGSPDHKWRSSTSMPRWASRLTLDNTGVTVELNFTRWDWVIGIGRLK